MIFSVVLAARCTTQLFLTAATYLKNSLMHSKRFFSVRRHNPLLPDTLKIGDDEALAKSHFNFSEPTVLFFHAFFESSQGATAIMIRTGETKKSYLRKLNSYIVASL